MWRSRRGALASSGLSHGPVLCSGSVTLGRTSADRIDEVLERALQVPSSTTSASSEGPGSPRRRALMLSKGPAVAASRPRWGLCSGCYCTVTALRACSTTQAAQRVTFHASRLNISISGHGSQTCITHPTPLCPAFHAGHHSSQTRRACRLPSGPPPLPRPRHPPHPCQRSSSARTGPATGTLGKKARRWRCTVAMLTTACQLRRSQLRQRTRLTSLRWPGGRLQLQWRAVTRPVQSGPTPPSLPGRRETRVLWVGWESPRPRPVRV